MVSLIFTCFCIHDTHSLCRCLVAGSRIRHIHPLWKVTARSPNADITEVDKFGCLSVQQNLPWTHAHIRPVFTDGLIHKDDQVITKDLMYNEDTFFTYGPLYKHDQCIHMDICVKMSRYWVEPTFGSVPHLIYA